MTQDLHFAHQDWNIQNSARNPVEVAYAIRVLMKAVSSHGLFFGLTATERRELLSLLYNCQQITNSALSRKNFEKGGE